MNAHSMAAAAYGTPNTALKTARSAEYDVIARITARLRKAHAGGAMSFPALAEALTENRRLWIEFTVDLSDPENPLPMALKGQLLSLANFTLNHTAAILEGRESAEVLIDINTAVMRGLAGKADVS
ncbi:MAG: flagellar biosynthesis regulatory protein FlaF [Rhodobacteraceae bacterium]|nr:MAG: flagellar biosynthesis regulatory protein FlaF [Paracoccaceae bacterium]